MRMPMVKTAFLLTAAATAAVSAMAEAQPYSRYQSIVTRQMFGPLPPDFDPAKMPSEVTRSSASQRAELTKEQEKLKSAIRFSVINMTPDGQVAVGFTDSSDGKNPRHYYLKVGESRGGWLVKEADPETATMTVAKGEIEVTLTIGGDSAKDAAATAKAGAAKAEAAPPANAPGGRSRLLGTLGGRRRAKDADAKAQAEELRRQREEDLKAREADREEMRSQLSDLRDLLSARREREEAAKANEAAKTGEAEKPEKPAPEGEGNGGETHENDDAE